MYDSLVNIPYNFISENLNGWVILVLIIIIIYFVALRTYYLKKEKFYDISMQKIKIKEIENVEEKINDDYNGMQNDDPNDETYDDITDKLNDDTNLEPSITKSNNKKYKNIIKSQNNQNKVKLKGEEVFERFEVSSPIASTEGAEALAFTDKGARGAEALVSTTLFNNLNLNAKQTSSCIMNYNEVINKYIIDLKKLNDMKNKNEYLNVKKQFDGIISKGIDNIITYLNNVIKTPNILTRTSIRTDVINTLSNNIENLINKENNDLTSEINKLAILNSTTIDYKNMTKKIDDSRSNIEIYMELDKLVSTYGRNISKYNRNINDVLNKSNLLPIYESNFDKINQLLKSDYNDDETKLSTKYGKAYTDFLTEKKKEDLDVNPMRLASQIESGIVNMLSNLYSGSGKHKEGNYADNNVDDSSYDNEEIIEQYNREYGNNTKIKNIKSNPIPSQQSNLINNTNLNTNANIYNDRGNIGSYLIDRKTQKIMLEGFDDETTNLSTTKGARESSVQRAEPSRGASALATTNPNTTNPNTNNRSASVRKNPLSPSYNGLINIDTINASSNMTIGGWNIGNTGIFDNNNNESNNNPDTTNTSTTYPNTTNPNTTNPNTTNPSTIKGARGASALATTNPNTTNPNTTNPNTTNPNTTTYKQSKKKLKQKDIISRLLSGDFLQYVMDIINEKLNMIYGMYDTKFNTNDYDENGNKLNNSKTLYGNFKLEENMIPAGFLLFILSMLVYFVDTTS